MNTKNMSYSRYKNAMIFLLFNTLLKNETKSEITNINRGFLEIIFLAQQAFFQKPWCKVENHGNSCPKIALISCKYFFRGLCVMLILVYQAWKIIVCFYIEWNFPRMVSSSSHRRNKTFWRLFLLYIYSRKVWF